MNRKRIIGIVGKYNSLRLEVKGLDVEGTNL